MNLSKKEQLEQKGVLVLLLIFALVLGSTLKSMGIIGGKKKRAQVEDMKKLSQVVNNLPGAMRSHSAEAVLESFEESLAVTEATQKLELSWESPVYAYNALRERDPLRPAFFEIVGKAESAGRTPSKLRREALVSSRRQQPHVAQPPELVQIQGVLWGGENPSVIVQGEVYGLGDLLADSARIIAITNQGVTVNKDGRFFQIGVLREGRFEEDALSWKPVAAPPLDAGSGKGHSMAAESMSLYPEGSLFDMPSRSPLLEGR